MKTIAKLMALCMLLGTLAMAQEKTAAPAAAGDKPAATDKDKDKTAKKDKKAKKDKSKDKDKDKDTKAGDAKK